jgi:putative membrane-bound dehydrogenase-like protein
MSRTVRFLFAVVGLLCGSSSHAQETAPIRILFLGDNGHHQPQARFRQLQPVFAERGIDLTYTDKMTALDHKILSRYDGLVLYANIDKIAPEQEKALLDYVAGGKGFIPLHCATFCFRNSTACVELMGAQFKRHGTGTFRATIALPEHPIMKGLENFESWDETYVHHLHNDKDRTILEYRVDKEGKEPWTWVRTHGKGRVFYTAWGHDDRTWSNPGFQALVERGTRWAVGREPVPPGGKKAAGPPEMTKLRTDAKPFEYVDAKVPFYSPKGRGTGADKPVTAMQLPVSPQESMKHMVTPVDFDIQLFASDPDIRRPICMNWDERGRLWIAETVDYPNDRQKAGEGHDRIVILEDTKGTGKADKFTVFADKLSIPTSFTFARGGVVVHQAPHTLFLKDTDGDDKADVREILFSGWGTYDTHAGPSNLQYGLDNWLYGIVGYSGFRGEIASEKFSFSQGFYRFKPDGSKFEFLRNTNNNSWGVGFSEEGILFGSTANGNPSVYMPIPNRYYEGVRGWSSRVLGGIAGNPFMHLITDKIRQVDYHGRFTAAAGHALYTARTYPKEYWNRIAFVAEPTGHIVATFQLEGKGSDFTSRTDWDLLASNDEWTAPTMAEVGPDGCVWIIDWYSYIVQHNPTPQGFKTGKGGAYETDLRDKKHGRIYRLVPKNAKLPEAMTLKDATPEKLVATLKNDNMFWRKHAQRLLVERGKKDVVPALVKLVEDKSVDAIGLNPGAIHALWTLDGIGALNGKDKEASTAVLRAMSHPSAGVRRNAVTVMPLTERYFGPPENPSRHAWVIENFLDGLDAGVRLLKDNDPQVRLAAYLAASEYPLNEARVGKALAQALSSETLTDRWLADALTAAAAHHDLKFLAELAKSKAVPDDKAAAIVSVVAEHYSRGAPKSISALLAELKKADPRYAELVLAGAAKGWPKAKRIDDLETAEGAMSDLLPKLPNSGKGHLLKLATIWGSKTFEKHLAEIASALKATLVNEKVSDQKRIESARQLLEIRPGDAGAVGDLLDSITPRSSPQFAAGLMDALGASANPEVGTILVDRLNGFTPATRAAALRVLLSRPEWARTFLSGVSTGKSTLADLTLDQKQALANHSDRKLAFFAKRLLEKGGGLPSADRQKVIDQLLPLTQKTGDAVLGKAVFKKQCMTCHTHSGEGTKIGPDLSGMAVHPKSELLIHIMDPSRSVEGNYRVYVVNLLDGRQFSGLMASETKTAVELFDAQAKKHVILREDIDTITATAKSLMPDGFEKQVSESDLVNLLEFLTQRGKYLPLALDKAATIVTTRGMFYSLDSPTERLIFADWGPKNFEGVPFLLVDPKDGRAPNAILLYSPNGPIAPKMPKSVSLPCNAPAKAIHLLSGVSGWGYPYSEKGTVSLIVRLHYQDGKTEDHALKNGEHFADYIRKVDVPGSKYAFNLKGRQIRYLAIHPERAEKIERIEFVKGPDQTAPVVMAVTVEGRE